MSFKLVTDDPADELTVEEETVIEVEQVDLF